MQAHKAIILARKHVGNGATMESSARAALADAVRCYDALATCAPLRDGLSSP